jgi:hypothetical protein
MKSLHAIPLGADRRATPNRIDAAPKDSKTPHHASPDGMRPWPNAEEIVTSAQLLLHRAERGDTLLRVIAATHASAAGAVP